MSKYICRFIMRDLWKKRKNPNTLNEHWIPQVLYCALHGSKVQCSAVQCLAAQESTVKHWAVQYSLVYGSTVQCSAVQCRVVQCSAG